MHDFTPIPSLLGGVLIGLAASLFLFTHGRVAGISGIYAGVLRREAAAKGTRVAFLVGLLGAGVVARFVAPSAFESGWVPSLPLALGAGVLVGIGTQLGNGCTSGHGVCGISRLSSRSLVATLTFIAAAMITVFVVRHVLGGAS
ncbi:MAG: YeeE/YedE family protein [Deltaproteobacteria bacterium]|nr:YeeE/YedE family protein [Deltaproteobacteria bacterium]